MNVVEKPMTRKERRAAEHAKRKAEYKAQRTAERTQAVGSAIDSPPSEPLNVPNVDSYIGGPRTPEGKQISSQNAVKHGSCSTAILINPNESLDDFLALEKRWLQSYKPESADETELIKCATRAEWFYLRAERNFAEYESQLGSPATWEENQHKTLLADECPHPCWANGRKPLNRSRRRNC